MTRPQSIRLDMFPSNWRPIRIKDICDLNGRIGFRGYTNDDIVGENEGAVTLGPGNLAGMSMDYTSSKYLSWEKYYESPEIMVHEGDIILAKTASVGKYAYVDRLLRETTVNPQLLVLNHFRGVNSKYLAYVIGGTFFTDQFMREVIGSTILTISQGAIGNIVVMLPTIEEQEKIVNYLDEKTSQIENYISEREKELRQLRRFKQAKINEVVVKGLDSEARLIDSGVTWLGKIPAHWQIKRMKDIFIESDELSTTGKEELLSVSEYYGVARRKERMSDDEEFETRADSLEGYKICHPGDLVSNIMLTWKRALGISDYEGIVSPAYAVYKGIGIEPKYYHYLLRSDMYIAEFKRNSTGIIESRLRLYTDRFYAINAIYPPLSEQKKIAEYLEKECALIDRKCTLIEEQIEKLQLLKHALVDEVVSGKRKLS